MKLGRDPLYTWQKRKIAMAFLRCRFCTFWVVMHALANRHPAALHLGLFWSLFFSLMVIRVPQRRA